jgi:Family of unknown function (DUF5706)
VKLASNPHLDNFNQKERFVKDLTTIEAQLVRTLSFFPRVDTKVAGLFTVNSAILTVSALNVEAGDLRAWYIAIPASLLVLGLISSYSFLYKCNFPELEGGQGSLVYFAEIQKKTESDYVAAYEAASDTDYRRDLLIQVWRNSQILSQKYRSISMAIRLTVATLIPFSIFLVMTAIEHTRVPVVGV